MCTCTHRKCNKYYRFYCKYLMNKDLNGRRYKKVLFISEMAQLKGIFLIFYAVVRLKYAAVMVHVGPKYSYFDKKILLMMDLRLIYREEKVL